MPNPTRIRRVLLPALLAVVLFSTSLIAADENEVIIWGLSPNPDDLGLSQILQKYNAAHPDIKLRIVTAGKAEHATQGGGFNQKFMTSLAAGKPPDLVYMDRFTLAGWAARGALRSLSSYLENSTIDLDAFYRAPVEESTFQSDVYGLPYGIDARAFFWNKELFRKAGLDPDRPPRDWNALLAYAVKMTKIDANGRADQIGFVPNFGNSWLYLYGWLNGAQFLSDDGRTVLLDSPEVVAALAYMKKVYDALGGRRDVVDPFERGFGRDATDPFLIGKIAMKIDGNWNLNKIARLAPDFELGVAPPPAPAGKPSTTWSGGFAWVIPKGSNNPQHAWKVIEYLVSIEGFLDEARAQSAINAEIGNPVYVPKLMAHKEANRKRLQQFPIEIATLQNAQELFVELLEVTHFRPVTPVGQQLWDEHVRALDVATYGTTTPKEALAAADARVQEELDAFYRDENRPRVGLEWSVALAGLVLFGGVVALGGRLVSLRRNQPRAYLEARTGLLFVSPWLIGFTVLLLWPIIASIVLSFTEYNVLNTPRWVGAKHFLDMFAGGDPMFWKSLWNTAYLAGIGVPLSMIVGLSIAMLVNTHFRGIAIFRTIFYLPSVVPAVAAALLWIFLLNPQNGLINFVLIKIGAEPINWIGDPRFTKISVLFMLLWGAGGSMVIWLAGLKSIPQTIYEAAIIDGAGPLRRFIRITLPLLSPYIFFNLIMSLIAYFQIFTQAYLVDPRGGPDDSLRFFVFYLFDNAFKYFKMGYASAMAWLLFLIILVLTLVNFKLAPRWVHYADE